MRAVPTSAQGSWYKPETLNVWESPPATDAPAETGLCHVGTLPSLRKTCGDHAAGQEIPGAGAKFTTALLSVHQPGYHTLWAILLESGLPILSRDVPIAG